MYEKIVKLKGDIVERSKVLLEKVQAEYKKKLENEVTTTAFVTLRSSLAARMLFKLNRQELSDRIRRFFTSLAVS